MRRFALFALFALFLPLGHAQQDPNKKFEVYPVGIADFDLIAETAKQMASPEGKVIADEQNRRIIVVDKPEVHAEIQKLIKALQVPQQNVRIKVRFDEHGSSRRQKLGVGGTVKSGDVTVTTTGDPKEGIHVDAIDNSATMSSMTQQELLVVNNGSASLEVTTEVPYYEWIFNYGVMSGYWTADTKWKPVGARLRVKPTISGNTIRIKLTPELSRLIDAKTASVSLEKLSTEVVAGNGQEISLGGIPAEAQEFYSKFLVGYDTSGRARSLNIYLTPTIEEPMPMPK
jgi:type II secretory pathway component GspD/PulD (secretin)